jgi:hypothetical protein
VRRLILHIGREKTGSTSFQAYCADRRERLAAMGVLYPANSACFLRINHAPLAASYFSPAEAAALLIAGRRADRAQAVAALKAESEQAELTLVSAEHFASRFDPGRIAALAADLSEYETSIAVVLRHPLARALSAYATTVASGRDITLDAYVDELCKPDNPYLLNRGMLEAWSSVFGRDQMIVIAYREGEDIVPALVERLLPCAAAHAGSYRRNVSPPAAEIERRRRANSARLPALARYLSRLRGPRSEGVALTLSADQARRIEARTERDLYWLAREYGINLL